MQRQEDGGRETVLLARRRRSGRYTRSVRSTTEGLLGACQEDRFKVSCTHDKRTTEISSESQIMSLGVDCFFFIFKV